MKIEKSMVIPIFIPHNGCPNDCVFCNQKKISGYYKTPTMNDVENTIEQYLKYSTKYSSIEIGFYGGSFTGVDEKLQLQLLEVANKYLFSNKIHNIRLSTRPDYINDHILDYLKEYKVGTIELGVQSLDNEVLRISNRGHTKEHVYDAVKRIKLHEFELGIQTMIGLPGDDESKAIKTAEEVLRLNPSVVRIYPTLVIKDTELENSYLNGSYVPLSLLEAVNICKKLFKIYYKNKINLIRVGLQPTENIYEGRDVVAGPFHPAFRQLVEADLVLDYLKNEIIQKKLENSQIIIIKAQVELHSLIIGQKKCNVDYIKSKFGINKIKLIESGNVFDIELRDINDVMN